MAFYYSTLSPPLPLRNENAEQLDQVLVYDVRTLMNGEAFDFQCIPTSFTSSWQELYNSSNLIITCTVSDHRYIDMPPSPGSLLLNVSLRDYWPSAIPEDAIIIVDNWEEVCRENTDIELLHQEAKLLKAQTISSSDVVCQDVLADRRPDSIVFFNPMGMAVFDIAVADLFARHAQKLGIGLQL